MHEPMVKLQQEVVDCAASYSSMTKAIMSLKRDKVDSTILLMQHRRCVNMKQYDNNK